MSSDMDRLFISESLRFARRYMQLILPSVQRGWPERDPPLTELGLEQARKVSLTFKPDRVICSPMTRTIQTMYAVLSTLENSGTDIPKEIWPNLREAHDAICNKGVSRAIIAAAYPTLDFSRCNVEWDYEEHSDEAATLRAKEVLDEVRGRPEKDILLVGHRAFLAYLVGDERFLNCGKFRSRLTPMCN